jgi:hypothetical protein
MTCATCKWEWTLLYAHVTKCVDESTLVQCPNCGEELCYEATKKVVPVVSKASAQR